MVMCISATVVSSLTRVRTTIDGDSGRVMAVRTAGAFVALRAPDSFDAVTHKALAKEWA